MGRSCSQNEEGRTAFIILKGKPLRKKPLKRPRLRWEDNIMNVFYINMYQFEAFG